MIKFLIERSTAVFVSALLVILVGAMAYASLPREASPEIKQPYIFVNTVYAGVAPKDIESLITRPIEEEIDGIEGIDNLTSSSAQSFSSIFVEFSSDVDVETALRKVKERVDIAKASLPDDVNEPVVREFSSSDWPIFTIALSHPDGLDRISDSANLLQDKIKSIYGVLDVTISGDLEKELSIEIDPLKLQHYDLTLDDVANAIRFENMNIPGGTLENASRNYSLSVTGEITDPDEFRNITIRSGGLRVKLEQLGEVRFQNADANSLSRLNGSPAITIEVKKRLGQNIVDIVDLAKQEVEELRDTFPEGTLVTYTSDQSQYIKDMILDLENNMLTGFLLVLLVTIFFLGKTNSIFVSMAIPFSMLLSFFVIQALGITLNMIVLFSLILALGMLVDNGIVIVENVFRHASMGKGRVEAAIDGVKEVAGPIITSTLTTILAFFPIIFMPGVMGDFMSYLPMTVIIVLTSSLLVALIINPVFLGKFLRINEKTRKQALEGSGLFNKFQNLYGKVVQWATHHAGWTVVITFVVVIAGFALYGMVGKEPIFFPNSDPTSMAINLEARQGTPLAQTDLLIRRVEEMIPNVEISLDNYQGRTSGNTGSVRVNFESFLERDISGEQAVLNVQEALEDFTGADVRIDVSEMGPPAGNDISYAITGPDYEAMGDLALQVKSIIEEYEEIKLVNTDYEPAQPEIAININRELAAFYDLSTMQIASTIRNAINGSNVGTFRMNEEEYDINLRYQRNFRDSIEALENLQVVTNRGNRIPIQSVAEISYRSSVGVIKRRNLERTIEVWADFKIDTQNKGIVSEEIAQRIEDLNIPVGYDVGSGSGSEIQAESTSFLGQAFMIALFMILIVLIAQFNSLIDPLIIIVAVFLSLGGVFWGYALSGQVFVVIMSGIGSIALAGVAVNNCIVLVDYTNILMKEGKSWKHAVVESGKTRLRPVILTAITTVLGLIPMAMGISINVHFPDIGIQWGSEQSEFWKAFAWAMIYGLSFATIMTLVIVPAMLTLKFKFKDWIRAKKDKKKALKDQKDAAMDAISTGESPVAASSQE